MLLFIPPGIHAHNDYAKPRPFWAAYEAGASSIEADVFPVDGELRLAHSKEETRPGFTLETAYLQPMQRLHRAGELRPIWLLVDVKAEGRQSYLLLTRLLGKYLPLLETPARPNGRPNGPLNGRPGRSGPVRVIVSGERPLELFRGDSYPLMWLDGRLADRNVLSRFEISRLSPLLSESILSVKDPAAFVEQGAEFGQATRLWGTPDTPSAWREYAGLGLGLINTDRPAEAVKILRSEPASRQRRSSAGRR